ncbi:MAG: HlyD family efflux transporter periplasmic adaptor subunit [Gammaproteobacteria bacterium]|nr:HlyD family efflux transporter periplasmic adaptor subunit [Gammaproteobacteria bacterium]
MGESKGLADRLPRAVSLWRGTLLGTSCLLALLIWAALTRVEIVVTAPATARPVGGNTELRAPAARRVAHLHVREGQRVSRGQLIAVLGSGSEDSQWRSARVALAAQRRVLRDERALLGALDGQIDAAGVSAQVRLRLREHRGALAGADAQAASLLAEQRAAAARAAALRRLIAVKAERRAAVEAAGAQGAMSRFEVLRAREDHLAHAAELAAAQGLMDVAGQRLRAQRQQRITLDSGFRSSVRAAIDAAEVEVMALRSRLAQAAEQRRNHRITAPADGLMHRVHVAAGEFVAQGDSLGVLVPNRPELVFETRVAPGQTAFLREGQACRVKLDALPFARYGAIPCTVTALDQDAEISDQGAAHYRVNVHPAAVALRADGEPVRLLPGATGWVDVIAGERTVLSFVTEPLWRFTRESLREW